MVNDFVFRFLVAILLIGLYVVAVLSFWGVLPTKQIENVTVVLYPISVLINAGCLFMSAIICLLVTFIPSITQCMQRWQKSIRCIVWTLCFIAVGFGLVDIWIKNYILLATLMALVLPTYVFSRNYLIHSRNYLIQVSEADDKSSADSVKKDAVIKKVRGDDDNSSIGNRSYKGETDAVIEQGTEEKKEIEMFS